MQDENLNPLSGKGTLSFVGFVVSLTAIVVFNIFVFAMIKAQLIPARLHLDQQRSLAFYGLWFIFSSLGFWCVTNAFIKRWAGIFREKELTGFSRTCIRIGLLSPVLCYSVLALTLLFFPGSPLEDRKNGASPLIAAVMTLVAVALSVLCVLGLPAEKFGMDGASFRESIAKYIDEVQNPIPKTTYARPLLSLANPGARYLAWMAADYYRSRVVSAAIQDQPEMTCSQRLGFVGVEVDDCYFFNIRKMAEISPLVSPYFGFYFESMYRQSMTSALLVDMGNNDQVQQTGPIKQLATMLLILSNQVELLEPGPMFKSRAAFIEPSFLLRAFASPEIPIVEISQDMQRFMLLEKLLPIFELGVSNIRSAVGKVGPLLGPRQIDLESQLTEIESRIAVIRRDPLLIGVK